MSKKPWYPYQLHRNEHILLGGRGKFYVAVVYGGYVQFISEMDDYLINARVDCVSNHDTPLKQAQLDVCARIIGAPVLELN